MSHLSSSVQAAQCIQTNALLTTPLKPVFDQVGGAFGGILLVVGAIVAVALALGAIFTITSKKSSQLLKAMMIVLLIPIGLIVALIMYSSVILVLNNVC